MGWTWLELSGAALAGFVGGIAWCAWRRSQADAPDTSGGSDDRAQLGALLTDLPVACWISNGEGQVLWAHPLLLRSWGVPPEWVAPEGHAPPPAWLEAVAPLEARALAGETVRDEIVLLRDGASRRQQVVVSPRQAGGVISGVIGLAIELPVRALPAPPPQAADPRSVPPAAPSPTAGGDESRPDRTQQLQTVARLAAGVAHEFNNLLAPILIEVERLGAAEVQSARVQEHVRTIRGALETAREFTERAQMVAGDPAGPREWARLPDVVPPIVASWQRHLDPRIQLVYSPVNDMAPISLAVSAVERIVTGLLANAQDALVEKLQGGPTRPWTPQIEVALEVVVRKNVFGEETPYQAIVVADNGGGLAQEQQRRLFEPLFTTKAAGRGRGLGLAIIRNLAAVHQGFVDFVSEPGRGTRVHVLFPEAAVAAAQLPSASVWVAPPRLAASTNGQRAILLVEDNLLVADALAALLRDAGHRVTCVGDGQDAWVALQREPQAYDLVVTDLNMPGMSGKELLEKMKAARLPQPVLLITGYTDAIEVSELLGLGASAVIKKPVHPVELLTHVAEAQTA